MTPSALNFSDRVLTRMRATTKRRLQACDPSALSDYAEHLVALLIRGEVVGDAWGPIDVFWTPHPLGKPVEIQVKAARVYRTFNRPSDEPEPARTVSFSISPSETLKQIQVGKRVPPGRRGAIWVFALHTHKKDYRSGWWFFVVRRRALR